MTQRKDKVVVYQAKTLPSHGITYPPGSRVYYKPYSIGDILQFSKANMDVRGVYEKILEGIDTVGFKKEDLLLVDFTMLSIYRKCASYPVEGVEVEGKKCKACGKDLEKKVLLEDLEFGEPKFKKPTVGLVVKGVKFELKPWTIGMEIEYLDVEEKNVIQALARTLADKEQKEDFITHLSNAPKEDYLKLWEVWALLYLTARDVRVTCTCKEEANIPLRVGGPLLRPFCRNKASNEISIEIE